MRRYRLTRAALAGLLLAGGLGTVAARAQDCANDNKGVSVLQGCDTLVDLDIVALGEQNGDGGGSESGSGSNTNSGLSVAQLSDTDIDLNLVSTDDEADGDTGASDCANRNSGISVLQACDTDISVSVIGSGSEEDDTSSVSGPWSGSGSNDNSGISLAQLSGTKIDLVLLNPGRNGGTEPPGEGGGDDTDPPSTGGSNNPPSGGGSSNPPSTPGGGNPTNPTPPGAGNTGTTPGPGNPGTNVSGSTLTIGELASPFRAGNPDSGAAGIAPHGTSLAPSSVENLPVALPSLSGGNGSPLARTGFPAQAVVFIGVFLLLAGRSVAGAGRGMSAWRRR